MSAKEGDDDEDKPIKTGDVAVMDLVPCTALCCCILSLYADIPDCFGTVCENTLLCCNCKIMTCKPSKEPGAFCKICALDWDFIPFRTISDLLPGCKGRLPANWRVSLSCDDMLCYEVRDVDNKAGGGGKTGPYKFEEEWEAKVDPQSQLV
eukprot:gene33061-39993_t